MAKHTRSRGDDPPPLRSRGDEAWKLILEHYLAEFLKFFSLLSAVIWSQAMLGLSRRIGIGKRIADRLVKIFLNDGGEKRLLLHIEIQGKSCDPVHIFLSIESQGLLQYNEGII